MNLSLIVRISAMLSTLFLAASCERQNGLPSTAAPTADHKLAEHTQEFRRELIRVSDRVYVAVGYSHANSILIEGDDGVIVVDAMTSQQSAESALEAFRQITSKPVMALIYTHSHPDHIGGSAVFAPPGSGIPVYAHRDVERNYSALVSELQPVLSRRAQRMYGTHLTDAERLNIGIGERLDAGEDHQFALAAPTHIFDDRLALEIAGVKLELVHAPGETDDQLFVWLPDERVLMPGDNLYRAFPNLYTIRGTTYRDPKGWAASLDAMRILRPAFLVPSHSRPIVGETQVAAVLTDYRDAIRYVYEQTIRMINQGLSPDQIAHRLHLPEHLAASPWLQDFYGKPSWSAKSIFSGQLGWFDGNPTHLQPLEPTDEARKMVSLAGGSQGIAHRIAEALSAGEHQWALQLSDYALQVDPDDAVTKQARVRALLELAGIEVNPNARNYYLTAAQELRDGLILGDRMSSATPQSAAAISLAAVFDGIACNLDAEAAREVQRTTVFEFPDAGQSWTLTVRRGVTEIYQGAAVQPDIHVRVSAQAFKEMLGGLRNPMVSLAKDFEFVVGGRIAFIRFMTLFKPEGFDEGNS